MTLICSGALDSDLTKEAIAKIDKTPYINSIDELRVNFEKNGVLLLNSALIFTKKEESKVHIKAWRGFIETLLSKLKDRDIELILFGKAAEDIKRFESSSNYKKHILMHPYNISFITDSKAHKLFAPMRLLDIYS